MSAQPSKINFRDRIQQMREEAVIAVVYRLLAIKGYEAMTVDEVAAEAGIAKASLYKHFESKEALACAAMVTAIERGVAFLHAQDAQLPAITLLRNTVRWLMELKIRGEMPALPARNSILREQLASNKHYMRALMECSEILGGWIERGQQEGSVNRALPALVILYTVYARACDPVLEFLRDSDLYTDKAIVDMVLTSCFSGLASEHQAVNAQEAS